MMSLCAAAGNTQSCLPCKASIIGKEGANMKAKTENKSFIRAWKLNMRALKLLHGEMPGWFTATILNGLLAAAAPYAANEFPHPIRVAFATPVKPLTANSAPATNAAIFPFCFRSILSSVFLQQASLCLLQEGFFISLQINSIKTALSAPIETYCLFRYLS